MNMQRIISAALFGVIYFWVSFAFAATEVGGRIDVDTTWSAIESPYVLTQGIILAIYRIHSVQQSHLTSRTLKQANLIIIDYSAMEHFILLWQNQP